MTLIEKKLAHVHKELAHIVGAMSTCLVKRAVSPSEVFDWSRDLSVIAEDLEELEAHLRKMEEYAK